MAFGYARFCEGFDFARFGKKHFSDCGVLTQPGSIAPRIVKAPDQIATGVVTKLLRNQRPGPERVTLIGLSNQETDHERQRSDPIEQSTAPSALEQRQAESVRGRPCEQVRFASDIASALTAAYPLTASVSIECRRR
jgi:hypothetical protein